MANSNFRKVISLILSVVMLFSVVQVCEITATVASAEGTEYHVGDIVEFGSYPQSQVKDETLLAQLNELPVTWNSYGYYSGTGGFGSMTEKSFWKYADITFSGNKYRAVTFSNYRPYYTINACSEENSYQDDNGFSINTTYWFVYEPVQWRVLNPDTGYLLCENIIDCQPWSNKAYKQQNGSNYYCDAGQTTGLSSSGELRSWINSKFKNVAFNDAQQSKVLNASFLSRLDSLDDRYGFNPSDNSHISRATVGSDYAKAQGLNYNNWWLSDTTSGSYYSAYSQTHLAAGSAFSDQIAYSLQGIRISIHLSDLSECNKVGTIIPWATGENGINGQDGVGISNIVKTDTNGNVDTYTIRPQSIADSCTIFG